MKADLFIIIILTILLTAPPTFAFTKTFFPTSYAPTVVEPSGTVFPRLSTHRNLTEAGSTLDSQFRTYNISPGEIDGAGGAGPGNQTQWEANVSKGSTTAADNIKSAANGDLTNESLGAGWLYNNSLHNLKLTAGSWRFSFNISLTQAATSDWHTHAARITIRNTTGALITNLSSFRLKGAGAKFDQWDGWRDSDTRFDECAATCNRLYVITDITTQKNYTFREFDRLFIELGSNNASDTSDRTFVLITNQTKTNITTPDMDYIPQLRANHTSDSSNVSIETSGSTLFRGNCEAFNSTLAIDKVRIVVQNNTDNASTSYTNITTLAAEPVYANVTSYNVGGGANGNSSQFMFNITANTAGTYYLRIQCDTAIDGNDELEPTPGAQPTESNSSATPARPGTSFILTVTAAPDTCTPTANTDWLLTCSDNCVVTGKDFTVNKINATGSGTIEFINSNISYTELNKVRACTFALKKPGTNEFMNFIRRK